MPDTNWIDDLGQYVEGSPRFDYLTVNPNLYKLPWSVQDCCDRVSPKGAASIESKKLFSRHGILQLALRATPPFYGAPDGYIYDVPENIRPYHRQQRRPRERRLHACPQCYELLDALAQALLRYEARCLLLYQSPADERRQWALDGVKRVGLLLDVLNQLSSKGRAPERRELQYQRDKIKDSKKYLEDMISHVTEDDFRHAGFIVSSRFYNKSHATIKMMLISDMDQAFKDYTSLDFGRMATYRSIAVILNRLKVRHNQDGEFTTHGVKQIVGRRNKPKFFDHQLAGNIAAKAIFSDWAYMGTRIREYPQYFG